MSATISAAGIAPLSTGSAQPAGGNSLGSGSVAAAPPESAQIRFISPVVQLDAEAGLAVLRVRDTENGDVKMQIPAERVVREYRSSQAAEAERAPAQDTNTAPPAVPSKSTDVSVAA